VVTATPAQRVLVVDDDPTVADVVTRYLEREGFAVESVADGPGALDRAAAGTPALVVLDLMLPGLDGLEVCRRLRQMGPVPIIMLTALGEESDRVTGLDVGADDYIAKPFSPRELVARAKAVLRRAGTPPAPAPDDAPDRLSAEEIEVDVRAREVRVSGHAVSLTTLEFDLLTFLMRHPRRALRREELLDGVWGFGFGDTSTVTVHVRRLREKVEPEPTRPRHIVTVWGVGYRFDP
jgi:two-component system response regulator ResD